MYGIDGIPLALVVGIDHVPGLSVWIDGYQVMLVFRVTKILPVLLFPLRARQSGRLFLARILVVSDSLIESRREVCKLRCSQISVLISPSSYRFVAASTQACIVGACRWRGKFHTVRRRRHSLLCLLPS